LNAIFFQLDRRIVFWTPAAQDKPA